MRRTPRVVKWLGVLAILLGMMAWVAVAQNNKKINDSALKDAAKNKEEWISYNRDWSETRFSPLNQINADNVKKLGLAWSFDVPNVGAGNRQEATNMVANGMMFSITPYSVVYALDARTGKQLWLSDPETNRSASACCGVVNRGLALYEGKVIAPVLDGRLRALDMQTGKVLWETRVTPTNLPYTLTMAPRVIKGGRVIIGASGGEYAVRGFFAAFDATTGKELWKFYTVPGDPSKPFEQPIYADWAKTWDKDKKWWVAGGGGPVWGSIAYDPDEDLVYVGTGQPGPWTEVSRGTGDNLCTDCIIAVKGATGKYVWHYQTTPGDDWDFDSIADITLADLKIDGKTRKVLMHAPKNGFFFVIDRTNGQFISAEPWVTVNWASGIDPKTGKANVNPAARYQNQTGVNVIPGPAGGHVWPPQSFNPMTGLVYIPSTIGGGYQFRADPACVIQSAEIAEGARGRMQMGDNCSGGGRGGGAGAGGGRGAGAAPGLAPGLDPNAQGVPPVPAPAGAAAGGPPAGGPPAGGGGGGRGGGGGARGGGGGGGGNAGPQLPTIGPTGRGSILVAWNPVTQKEAWRGPSGSSAGYNAGGTLTTAGNLVFTNVGSRLFAFKADTGEQVLDLATGFGGSPGPPMTFMLDGKQYIAVAGAIGGGGGGGAGGGGGRGGGGAGGGGGRGGAAAAPGAGGAGAPGAAAQAGAAPGGQGGGGRGGGAAGGGRGGGGGGAAGAGGGGGGGGGRGAAAPQGPQAPASRLLVLELDGKPVTTPAPQQ